MKRILVTFAFLLVVQLGMAQNDAFKKDALQLIEKTGATATMNVALKQVKAMIPQDKHAEFQKDFEKSLPALYEKMAKIYMELYTHEDVKQLLKFYETPVGKKMSDNAGAVYEKTMEASQEWATEFQALLMKYMQ